MCVCVYVYIYIHTNIYVGMYVYTQREKANVIKCQELVNLGERIYRNRLYNSSQVLYKFDVFFLFLNMDAHPYFC